MNRRLNKLRKDLYFHIRLKFLSAFHTNHQKPRNQNRTPKISIDHFTKTQKRAI